MSFATKGLREQRGVIGNKQQALLALAVKENRGLTSEEQAQESAYDSEYKLRTVELERLEAEEQFQFDRSWGAKGHSVGSSNGNANQFQFSDHHGNEIRSLAPSETLSQSVRENGNGTGEPTSIGRCIRAAVTGQVDTLNDAERRGLMGGTDTTGGFLLNPSLSANVIDLARAASVCLAAGAQTVNMPTSELKLARLTSDPTGHWRGEGVRVAASNPIFGLTTLRARTLAAIIPISIELAQDAPNASSVIEAALQASMASEIDRACLVGTGAGSEPLGVKNYLGVGSVTSCGYPSAYTKARTALQGILTANYNGPMDRLSWICHPRTANTYDSMVDGDGDPLPLSGWVGSPKRLVTTSLSITENGAESTDIIGDFSQMLIGVRSQVNIRVLDSGQATDSSSVIWSAADQLLKLVVCYCRMDMILMRPSWFATVSGITTS